MPSADQAFTKPVFRWLVVALGVLVLGAYVFAGSVIIQDAFSARSLGWTYSGSDLDWYVERVNSSGPAANKLENGDRILAINGDARVSQADPGLKLRYIAPGAAYTIRVAKRSRVEVPYELTRSGRIGTPELSWMGSLLLVGLAFYVAGIAMGLLRPNDPVTRLGFVFLLACAVHLLGFALYSIRNDLIGPALVLWIVSYSMSFFQYAFGYHFASVFPAGAGEGKAWKHLTFFIYAVCVVISAPRTALNFLPLLGEEGSLDAWSRHAALIAGYLNARFTFEAAFQLLVLISSAIVIARNFRSVTSHDQLRRMKWLIYGIGAGIVPLSVYALTLFLLNISPYRWITTSAAWRNVAQIVNISVIAFPITLMYAAIKHRVLGIEFVLRRGIQYLLAKNVLRCVLALPLIALGIELIASRDKTLKEVFTENAIYIYVAIAIAAAVSLKFQASLRHALDRRFFREEYDREKILLNLIEQIKYICSTSAVFEIVRKELDTALHPHCIHFFYRDRESSELTLQSSSQHLDSTEKIPAAFQLLHEAEKFEAPFEVSACLASDNGLADDERKWLSRFKVQLLVPIFSTSKRLTGLMLLGEKKSEEPYTRTDRALLQAIVGQIAIVCENLDLQENIDQERRVHHRVMGLLRKDQIDLIKECPRCGVCFESSFDHCPHDGSSLMLTVPVDRTLGGRYRLECRIGKGGMGAVYRAEDLDLRRKVAIKIMMGDLFGDQSALKRFQRGAHASARLNHRNIVRVYDYGALRGNGAFLVMELLTGITWRSELNKYGKIDQHTAADWFYQLTEGMKAAHEAGIVHRDLKPENVFIAQHGGAPQITILDFGLAKLKSRENSDATILTEVGMVLGTVGYMAPEQLTGGAVDQRADIFSIGVMAVETITGSRPFKGKTYSETLSAILNQDFNLTGAAAGLEVLNFVLKRCLAKEPSRRYVSVLELQNDLIPAIKNYSGAIISRGRSDEVSTASIVSQ